MVNGALFSSFGLTIFPNPLLIVSKAYFTCWHLRQEFYGLPRDKNLFRERALKEAVHELGHTYGLGHCPDSTCVMHFSNSLPDTDLKGWKFCPDCQEKVN